MNTTIKCCTVVCTCVSNMPTTINFSIVVGTYVTGIKMTSTLVCTCVTGTRRWLSCLRALYSFTLLAWLVGWILVCGMLVSWLVGWWFSPFHFLCNRVSRCSPRTHGANLPWLDAWLGVFLRPPSLGSLACLFSFYTKFEANTIFISGKKKTCVWFFKNQLQIRVLKLFVWQVPNFTKVVMSQKLWCYKSKLNLSKDRL